MSRIRNCQGSELRTGKSKCPLDLKRIKGALLMHRGQKLPAELTAQSLEQMCHADIPGRVYPIGEFVDFARNGGEVQTSNVGYGPTAPNGMSARDDVFTLDRADDGLHANMLKTMGTEYDVYFVDDNNVLYGYDDGSGVLGGIRMSSVYPDDPIYGGAEKAQMTIHFCYKDVQNAMEHFQFIQLDFNPMSVAYGLVGVVLKEVSSGQYKIIEEVGGLDRTDEFGTAVQTGAESVVLNGSTVSYKNGLIAITKSEGNPSLAAPSALFTADIKGIEYVRTEAVGA